MDFDRDEMEPIAHINQQLDLTLVAENPHLFEDALAVCDSTLERALGTRTLNNGELLATHALLSHIHRVQANAERRKRFEVEWPGGDAA